MPHRLSLLGAMLLGGLLIFNDLGHDSLWLDELFSVRAATRESLSGLIQEVAQDVHPPLYFMLLRLWLMLVPHTDFWIRVPSAIAALCCIPLTMILGKRLFSANSDSAWLLASAPFAVALGREARANSLMALLGLIGTWLLEEESFIRLALYTLCITALLYTHIFGFFIVLAHFIFLISERPQTLPFWGKAWAISGIALVPWLSVLEGQMTHFSSHAWYQLPSADSMGWLWGALAASPGLVAVWLLGLGLYLNRSEHLRGLRWLSACLIALILIPQAVSYLWAPILRDRNVLFLLPSLCMVTAAGFSGLQSRLGMIVLVGMSTLASVQQNWMRTPPEEWREAAAIAVKNWEPKDHLVAIHPQLWRWYLPDTILPEALSIDPWSVPALGRTWILLAHDLPALPELKPEQILLDVSKNGTRTLLVDRGMVLLEGMKQWGGLVENESLQFYWNSRVVVGPFKMHGNCRLGVRAFGEMAGGEAAQLELVLNEKTPVRHLLSLPQQPELLWGEFSPIEEEATVEIAFINDGRVGIEDRNAHVQAVFRYCVP